MSKGYPCHHSTCKSTYFASWVLKWLLNGPEVPAHTRRGKETGKEFVHLKKKCTDIITFQLIHLTSLSLSPHPHWSRKNFSVGLFHDSMYSLFLFSHSLPPSPKNQSAKNISSFAEEVKHHQSLSKLPVTSFVY